MAYSWLGTGEMEGEAGASYARNQESTKRVMRLCQKDPGTSLKGFPLAKFGTIEHQKEQ